ncbi:MULTISPECIES: GNAT family N-acetyltransferase [Streptomyces]|uniref:GNAT family N-acetyltransferase n=1 Tax=Streptomyces TaxID=1883 RepID=UPI000317A910|nr:MULTISPECIES: GNAT family N-acetyltransferase [Streptomyces]MDX2923343.1 GNAT family N-acetyltransferase [Streptomyces sp. NRRL_B-16638]MDX3408788.1 GNAT family N-acetyltransferase [Streptomyces sp. ME02-6977A]TYP11672.1 acetyltransferase (GNAT) family protein [Streptomyces coelicolor]TYP16404.1 acetyltransferase (GNAT) family protein [Streptomyces coelicolor A3(2)]TYP36151.1 acetyltransferase (GNAT) family protein [Streptomyces coelicolor]
MAAPPTPEVRVLRGEDVLAHADALRSVYVDAFCAPPWNEDEEKAAEFAARIPRDARRPGFTAALAVAGRDVLGFASGWTTSPPFPIDRCYPQAAAGLGARRTEDWLCGAFEVDELAVRPGAQGCGLAGELLEAVTAGAPEGRSWLLTSVRAPRAMAFYHRQGWCQATHPSPDGKGIVVFLGPRHPARGLVPLPL